MTKDDVEEMTPDEMERLQWIADESNDDCACGETCMVCIASKGARVALKILAKDAPTPAAANEVLEMKKLATCSECGHAVHKMTCLELDSDGSGHSIQCGCTFTSPAEDHGDPATWNKGMFDKFAAGKAEGAELPPRPTREYRQQFSTALTGYYYVQYSEFKRYADALEAKVSSLQRELDEAREGADNLYKPLSDLVDAIEDAGGFDGNGDTFYLREAVSALEVHEKRLPSPPEPAERGSK